MTYNMQWKLYSLLELICQLNYSLAQPKQNKYDEVFRQLTEFYGGAYGCQNFSAVAKNFADPDIW